MRRVRNKNQIYVIVGIVIVVAVLVFGSAYYYVYNYVHQYKDNEVINGVYIEESAIGTMNAEEVETVIKELVKEKEMSSFQVTSDNKELAKADIQFQKIGLQVSNLDQLVKTALDYGKKGNLFARYKEIKSLENGKQVLHLSYMFDKEKAMNLITDTFKDIESKPVDAYIEVENGELIRKGGEAGVVLEAKKTIELLEQQLEADTTLENIKIAIEVKKEKPKVTLESLEAIQDELGSYKTTCRNTGGRYKNVQRGAELINGTILQPGESISVQESTAPYTKENGYFEAGAFENGEVIQSLAGGICQLCTTVYNAVLHAELEVTQRQAHSMLVSYVDPARDAAIAGTYKDLKFTNNLKTPIYIYANLSNEILEVKIYGQDDRAENREIKFQSITTGPGESAKTKFEVNTGASAGSKTRTVAPKEGKVAELWKYIYEDGVEVDKVKINTSRYIGSGATYAIGVKSEYPEVTSLLVNAVQSNDEQTIDRAIAQAQALIAQKNAEKEEANKPVTPPTEPETPPTGPETPPTGPETPSTKPETPSTEPEKPLTEPETPSTETQELNIDEQPAA